MKSPYKVHVIRAGYSRVVEDGMVANCTCTLVKGPKNIIVDTMTAWDRDVICKGLSDHGIKCEDVQFVVSTHGHSDHIGNNNLFLQAKHVVGFSVSFKDTYYNHSFLNGEVMKIDDFVEIIATPGHTMSDVTVLVKTDDLGLVAITGDLFEKEEDLQDSTIWMFDAHSEDPNIQKDNRGKIVNIADHIVPGHGPMFKVTPEMKAASVSVPFQQHYI